MTLRIVFVGADRVGTNDRSLREGFVELGHRCWIVDPSRLVSPRRLSREHLRTKLLRGVAPRALASFRHVVLRTVEAARPDLIVVFKGTWLDRQTARRLSSFAPILDLHPDDIGNPANTSAGYLESVEFFALSVTHRRDNVDELKALGARQVVQVAQSFDPQIHAPLPGVDGRTWDVSFVGSCRPERAEALQQLTTRTALRLRVAGHGWRRAQLGRATVTGPVWGLDFARVIAASTMSLGFVNHQNRDLRTYRSFEIPAIGAMLLAERTSEHEATFREHAEAVYFSSNDELIDRATHFAAHPAEAADIARNGHEAVWRMDATYRDRAAGLIDLLFSNDRDGSQ